MPGDESSLPPLVHNVEDAARRLGLGRTKFFELVASGQIETITEGTRRLVPEQSLEKYVAYKLAHSAASCR